MRGELALIGITGKGWGRKVHCSKGSQAVTSRPFVEVRCRQGGSMMGSRCRDVQTVLQIYSLFVRSCRLLYRDMR